MAMDIHNLCAFTDPRPAAGHVQCLRQIRRLFASRLENFQPLRAKSDEMRLGSTVLTQLKPVFSQFYRVVQRQKAVK